MMSTKYILGSKDRRALEYVLEDFLELKASLAPPQAKGLKNFLFSQPLDGLQVLPLEGFLLARHLVVLEKRDPEEVKHLVFVNPENGKVLVRDLEKVG